MGVAWFAGEHALTPDLLGPFGRMSLTLLLLVGACSAGDGDGSGTVRTALPDVTLVTCTGPRPGHPVQIDLALNEGDVARPTLEDLVAAFESTHPDIDVVVDPVDGNYEGLLHQWGDASDADRPDLALFPQHQTQRLIDSGHTVEPDRCMPTVVPDMLPAVRAAWSYDGRLRAVPLAVSTPLLWYNRRAFERAGLDPDDPPATLDEVRAASEQLVGRGVTSTGLVVDTSSESAGSWVVEQWLAQAGEPSLKPANGRDRHARTVAWDDGDAAEWLDWLAGMADDGLARSVGDNEGGAKNLYESVGIDQEAGMTLHTSGALAPVLLGLPSMALADFELDVAPLPGPGPGTGSLPGGGALWLAAGKPDDEAAAAWQLAAYLASGPVNAEWAARTGYVPLSASAGDTGTLQQAWAARPVLLEAFNVLAAHDDDPEDLGPLAGPLAELHGTLALAVSQVVDEGADPDEALAKAADDADRLLAAYNTDAPADPGPDD